MMNNTTKAIGAVAAFASIPIALMTFDKWQSFKDPQGDANEYCIKAELPPVPNHSGLVVTAHETDCDVIGGTSAVYVYVHKSGTVDYRGNLVFRYFDISDEKPLKIEWINPSSVRISVSHVSEVTKQLTEIGGVQVSYAIGKVDYPRTR
jgi:hypothetical protein